MRALIGTALALVLGASAATAQVTPDQLAKPPADAKIFSIVSTAGKHGSVWEWTAPDGTLMARLTLTLRGQVWDEDEAIRLGADGAIQDYVLRGTSPNGDVGETFHVANGTASWKSPIDSGSKAYSSAAYYLPFGIAPRAGDIFGDALTMHPDKDIALLPGGRAHAEKLATTIVGSGANQKTVVLWAITGPARPGPTKAATSSPMSASSLSCPRAMRAMPTSSRKSRTTS